MKTLTVFTPTYNRAHLLPRLYASLCAQSSKDFVWLVVDDGSSDGTRDLIKKWISDSAIEIRYVYKQNGGMHTAHNVAYEVVETELNVCIDSDDWMPHGAIASILSNWQLAGGDTALAGMLGLDQHLDGRIVGSPFPESGLKATLGQVYGQYRVQGDKKIVLRTEVVSAYPRYPEFPGERLVPIASLYTLIDQRYKLFCVNEVWATVEYQPDGSSATVGKQYFQSPLGFRHDALINLSHAEGAWTKFKNIVKLGVTDFILEGRGVRREKSPVPLLSLIVWPVSYLAYLRLRLGSH